MHKRHLLWSADGTWERLVQHVQAAVGVSGDIDWDINVDSTSIRVHQYAAGARNDPSSAWSAAAKGAAPVAVRRCVTGRGRRRARRCAARRCAARPVSAPFRMAGAHVCPQPG
ncbi:hypothetical protein CTZ27_36535 [Streptomyces griseocarneus]|nr:hypothetical protein CTZ27_36535 [Streptomyces griseocarneus]